MELILRSAEGWSLVERGPGEQLELQTIAIRLDVDELYDGARDLADP